MRSLISYFVSLVILLALAQLGLAQMSRKPSPSKNGREGMTNASSKRFLNAVRTKEEFDLLARTYNANTPYALPHAMFIIDRGNKNKVYFVNSKLFRFHMDFANAQYLSLKRGEDFFNDVYVNDKRRLIVGTIAWQIPVQKFTFEFWEGDKIKPELIKLSHDLINKAFFTEVAYKPNSITQEDYSADLGIPRISASEITKNQEYVPLNVAVGRGRIHIIDKLDDTVEIGVNEIVILNELPLDLPPVAGIIVSKPSSPLSHVNLLSTGWGIPNAYIKDAAKLFRELDGKWFEFETKLTNYTIKPCDKECLDKKDADDQRLGRVFKAPPSNLKVRKLATLREMRRADSVIYGSKSANLGEVIARNTAKSFDVPDGFGIPFVYYKEFMESNGFDKIADSLADEYEFVHNPRVRRQRLDEFRAKIKNGNFDDKLRAEIISHWKTRLGGRPVYVRSSSNAEDAGKFSGAGLYSSVENVTQEDKMIEAVKTVWASIWNYKAYEARERNFVEHTETFMAVLVQVGIAMENGGVMITKDPYDRYNKNGVYISATWGHNIGITSEKRAIPEQIVFSPKSNSVQVLTRSDQETMFVPDENGGLREVPFSNRRRVLSDQLARELVKISGQIKRMFGGVEQDIEWGIMKGRIYVVQARPYVEAKK